jgi:hypothetical protein
VAALLSLVEAAERFGVTERELVRHPRVQTLLRIWPDGRRIPSVRIPGRLLDNPEPIHPPWGPGVWTAH